MSILPKKSPTGAVLWSWIQDDSETIAIELNIGMKDARHLAPRTKSHENCLVILKDNQYLDSQRLLRHHGDHPKKFIKARHPKWSQRMNIQIFGSFQLVLPKRKQFIADLQCRPFNPRASTTQILFLERSFYRLIHTTFSSLRQHFHNSSSSSSSCFFNWWSEHSKHNRNFLLFV